MTSEVQIANLALDELGESHIASLAQNVKAARVINSLFAPTRDALLRSHPWNFATRRANIAADATAPEFGYTTKYAVPTGCLRVLEVRASDLYPVDDYKIEQGFILCNNTGALYVRYIERVEDTEKFDSLFVTALALNLALKGEKRIADMEATRREQVKADLKLVMTAARSADGQESTYDELDEMQTESWVEVRY